MECVQQILGLGKKTFLTSALATATTQGQFITPTDRGEGYAMDVTAASSVIADLDGCRMTVSINGVNIWEDVSLVDYSPLNAGYNRNTKEYLPFPSGVNLVVTVTNDSGTAIPVYCNLYFKQIKK